MDELEFDTIVVLIIIALTWLLANYRHSLIQCEKQLNLQISECEYELEKASRNCKEKMLNLTKYTARCGHNTDTEGGPEARSELDTSAAEVDKENSLFLLYVALFILCVLLIGVSIAYVRKMREARILREQIEAIQGAPQQAQRRRRG